MNRIATTERSTAETSITATIKIDGTGRYNIKTEIGFFDHMLEQLSKHSGMDIELVTKGDIHIDFHHSVEDTGIVLGKAFAKALGDCKGIYRYAHSYIPMDETLTRVALDISKRPFLVWKVKFDRDKIGDFDTELFQEFFRAFAFAAGLTLHVENLYGENNHHIAESCFKGLAKALKFAVKIDASQANIIPSTKNML
ncbi:MAG: imidazoleglycerol-phosphate dehydratase [Alphaproteobacteria bacterium]|jgi:imidazoleglycerol-phosphate dehydratase